MTNNAIQPSGTAMKPQTAAKKLGIYLPASPQEFQDSAVTHRQLRDMQENPPEWLSELRLKGPHPRPVVSQKLGISTTALKKNNMDRPLTTQEITELLKDMPQWLEDARKTHAEQRKNEALEGETKSGATAPAQSADVAVSSEALEPAAPAESTEAAEPTKATE